VAFAIISLVQSFAQETISPSVANAQLLTEVVPAVMWVLRTELRREQPSQLALPHLRLLMCLSKHPGASLSELAEFLGLLPSSTSKLVDHLVLRDLVTRQVAPDDRRRAVLALTAFGNETLEDAHCKIRAHLAERLAVLSESENALITQALLLLRDTLLPDGALVIGDARTCSSHHTSSESESEG